MKVTVQATHPKNEKTSIRIRQQIEGQKVTIPLLQEIPSMLFDSREQRMTKASEKHRQAKKIFGAGKIECDAWNQTIERAVAAFTSYVLAQRSAGQKVDGADLKKHVLASISAKQPEPIKPPATQSATLLRDALAQYIDHATKHGIGSDLKPMEHGTSKGYKTTRNKLIKYEEECGRDFVIMDFDREFRQDWMEYFDALKYERSYSSKHIDRIRRAVNWMADLGEAVHQDVLNRKMSKIEPEKWLRPALTLEELKQIKDVKLSGHLNKVRDLLLVQCFTGLRISDMKTLSTRRVYGSGDDQYIKLRTKKGDREVEIYLNETVQAIRAKYDGFPAMMAEQQYNESIKKVCKAAGIDEVMQDAKKIQMVNINGKLCPRNVRGNFPKYELISSHDLRRTFATVLYHETEMEQADIMAMTGHKSERTFLLYIHANPKHIRERAKKHFPQLA